MAPQHGPDQSGCQDLWRHPGPATPAVSPTTQPPGALSAPSTPPPAPISVPASTPAAAPGRRRRGLVHRQLQHSRVGQCPRAVGRYQPAHPAGRPPRVRHEDPGPESHSPYPRSDPAGDRTRRHEEAHAAVADVGEDRPRPVDETGEHIQRRIAELPRKNQYVPAPARGKERNPLGIALPFPSARSRIRCHRGKPFDCRPHLRASGGWPPVPCAPTVRTHGERGL